MQAAWTNVATRRNIYIQQISGVFLNFTASIESLKPEPILNLQIPSSQTMRAHKISFLGIPEVWEKQQTENRERKSESRCSQWPGKSLD